MIKVGRPFFVFFPFCFFFFVVVVVVVGGGGGGGVPSG